MTVTVCVTTYNRQTLLPAAVSCVVNQTYQDLDIIIIDDASTDGTELLVKQKLLPSDNRIRYYRHPRNKGLAAARNTAIRLAEGTYFAFLDDDDLWDPTIIAEFVNYALEEEPSVVFCCGNRYRTPSGEVHIIPRFEGRLLDYITQGYTPPVAAQFYRTEELRRAGGYHEEIRSGVDHDLWLTLAYRGCRLKSVPKALALENTDTGMERITTNYKRRKKRIQSSLRFWREDMVKYIGEPFYRRFCRGYLYYINTKRVKQYLRQRRFLTALGCALANNNPPRLITELTLNSLKKFCQLTRGTKTSTGVRTAEVRPAFPPYL